jgi:hypothetical protein
VSTVRKDDLAGATTVPSHERIEHRARGLAGSDHVERCGGGERMGVEGARQQRRCVRGAKRGADNGAKVGAKPGVTQ